MEVGELAVHLGALLAAGADPEDQAAEGEEVEGAEWVECEFVDSSDFFPQMSCANLSTLCRALTKHPALCSSRAH